MIEVKELRRSFGPVVAVDGISFNVQEGEVLGLLGPNGAGKTTAMRILACFLRPDSGTATICGYDILKNPIDVRRSLGYLAENVPAYNEMTVGSFLNFICDVREITGRNRKETLDRIVPMCAIESVYHQSIETLSKGYKRRVGLAQALMHDPDVLILDEPTDGLDPNQKHEVRKLIQKMAKNKCIIVSTHILEEVEAVCSRTIIIARGKILVDSTPGELKEKYQCSLDAVFRKITRNGIESMPPTKKTSVDSMPEKLKEKYQRSPVAGVKGITKIGIENIPLTLNTTLEERIVEGVSRINELVVKLGNYCMANPTQKNQILLNAAAFLGAYNIALDYIMRSHTFGEVEIKKLIEIIKPHDLDEADLLHKTIQTIHNVKHKDRNELRIEYAIRIMRTLSLNYDNTRLLLMSREMRNKGMPEEEIKRAVEEAKPQYPFF